MKLKKLSLSNFEAVDTQDLFEIKGGYGYGGAGCGGQWTAGDFIANGIASSITDFMDDVYDRAESAAESVWEAMSNQVQVTVSTLKVVVPYFLKLPLMINGPAQNPDYWNPDIYDSPIVGGNCID